MNWVAWFGFATYGIGWFLAGFLIGRHQRAKTLDQHIDTAVLLAKAGREQDCDCEGAEAETNRWCPTHGDRTGPRPSEDTALRRAQTARFPDRSGWDPQ